MWSKQFWCDKSLKLKFRVSKNYTTTETDGTLENPELQVWMSNPCFMSLEKIFECLHEPGVDLRNLASNTHRSDYHNCRIVHRSWCAYLTNLPSSKQQTIVEISNASKTCFIMENISRAFVSNLYRLGNYFTALAFVYIYLNAQKVIRIPPL